MARPVFLLSVSRLCSDQSAASPDPSRYRCCLTRVSALQCHPPFSGNWRPWQENWQLAGRSPLCKTVGSHGSQPGQAPGPRPLSSSGIAGTNRPHRTDREQRCLSPPHSQGDKPRWSHLSAPAPQALRQPVIHPPDSRLRVCGPP